MGGRSAARCGQAQRQGRSYALSHATRIGIKLKRECYWVLFGVLVLLGATWSVGAAGRYLERRCCWVLLGASVLLGAGASVVLDAGPGGWVRVQIVGRKREETSEVRRSGKRAGLDREGALGREVRPSRAGGCGSTTAQQIRG